jgi:hypothetical protein
MKVANKDLLSRDNFRNGVFQRDNYLCVICGLPGVDAHHIIERRLFDDGGYYLDNGATVCEEHHLACESLHISTEEVRRAAGIVKVVLPYHFDNDNEYDKWGNIILPTGAISPGELFYDESVQKIMRKDLEVVRYAKYPRTPHLPWSKSSTKSDIDTTIDQFLGNEVVVTEKLDGENTTMYRDKIHARSINSDGHPSRAHVKALHAQICYDIPESFRIVGENLAAKHSIYYDSLPSYFIGFTIFDGDKCLSYDETQEWFALLGITTAPVLYRGIWEESRIKRCMTGVSKFGGEQEGYVVRNINAYHVQDFKRNIAKYVRENHVQTAAHNWLRQEVVWNGIHTKA